MFRLSHVPRTLCPEVWVWMSAALPRRPRVLAGGDRPFSSSRILAKCPGQVPSLYSILVWYKIVWHKICVCSCVSVSGCVLLQFDVLLCWAVHLIVAALGLVTDARKMRTVGARYGEVLVIGKFSLLCQFLFFLFFVSVAKKHGKHNKSIHWDRRRWASYVGVLYYLDLSISSSYCNNGCVMQVGM